MKPIVVGLSCLALLACPSLAPATILLPPFQAITCDDQPLVADVLAQIGAQCDCAGAATHGLYVRCAGPIIRSATAASRVCRRALKKYVVTTTCGRPGSVICCNWRGINESGVGGVCNVQPSAEGCHGWVAARAQGIACPVSAPGCNDCPPPDLVACNGSGFCMRCGSPSGAFVDTPETP